MESNETTDSYNVIDKIQTVLTKDFISKNIDILRGIAILLVLIVHTYNMSSAMGLKTTSTSNPDLMRAVLTFMSYGATGVGLFFFISGFLIFMLYWNSMNAKSYFVRRVSRIVPLWGFWLIVSLITATVGLKWWFSGTEHGQTMTEFVYGSGYNVLDVNNLIPIALYFVFLGFLDPAKYNWVVPGGWSIQTEVFHYAIFPFLRKVGMTLTILIVLTLQLGWLAFTINQPITKQLEIASAYIIGPLFFTLGMVISSHVAYLQSRDEKFKINTTQWGLMILALLISFFIHINPNIYIDSLKTLSVVLLSIYASFYIYKTKFLKNIVTSIGKYSYGIYFAHFLAMPLFSHLTVSYLFDNSFGKIEVSYALIGLIFIFSASLAAAYIISLGTYYLFEKRIINWSKKY